MAEFLSHPVPAVIILLGLLVLIHELGHFLVGRWAGVAVEIFSIGFGPAIVNWKRGETDYRISWVPLGGFVKFYGSVASEPVPEHVRGRELYRASLRDRALIAAAGPVANLLLAIVAYAALGFSGIAHPSAVIGEVLQGSAAERAGLQFQDEVIEISGRTIKSWRDLEKIVSISGGKPLEFKVKREEQILTIPLTPDNVQTTDMADRPVTIGRAGVARGMVSSVITVRDRKSIAARAGLKSGEEIIGISWSGQEYEIKYWQEFVARTRQAYATEVAKIRVKVRSGTLPGQAVPADLPVRDIELIFPSRNIADAQIAAMQTREGPARILGIQDAQLLIGAVEKDVEGPLRPNDLIVGFDGKAVADPYQLREALLAKAEAATNLEIVRDFVRMKQDINLKGIEVQKPSGKATIYTLPVGFWGQAEDPAPVIEQYRNPLMALYFGAVETARHSRELVVTIGGLIAGDIPVKALGGPMLIAKIAGDSAKLGWQAFVNSLALISINLALLNLFPIPVLDGGQLVLMGIEAVRRRPLSETAIENFQKVGFVMVMALVILATYNDFSRFWTSMLQSMSGLFQ